MTENLLNPFFYSFTYLVASGRLLGRWQDSCGALAEGDGLPVSSLHPSLCSSVRLSVSVIRYLLSGSLLKCNFSAVRLFEKYEVGLIVRFSIRLLSCSRLLARKLRFGLPRQELTEWDTIAGDGDCGDTLKRGAQAVLSALQDDRSGASSASSGSSRALRLGDLRHLLRDLSTMSVAAPSILEIASRSVARGLPAPIRKMLQLLRQTLCREAVVVPCKSCDVTEPTMGV